MKNNNKRIVYQISLYSVLGLPYYFSTDDKYGFFVEGFQYAISCAGGEIDVNSIGIRIILRENDGTVLR